MGTVHPRRRGGSRPSARAGRASEGRGKERAEYYERTRGAGADSRRARRRGAHRPGARTGRGWGGAARPRSPPDDDSRARRLPEERPPPARARPPPPPSPPPALPARPPAAAPSPSPASACPAPRAPARPRPGRTEPSGGAAEVGRRQRSRTRQERCAPPAPPPLGGAGGGRRPTPRRLRAPGRTSWALRSCLRRRCSVRPGRAGTALRRWKETKPLLPPSPAPPPSCRREDEGDLPPAAFLFRRLSLAPCRPQRFSNWAAPTRAVTRVVYVTVPASSAPIGWGEGYISGGEGLTSRTESHDIISKQSALTSLTGRGLHRWRLGAPIPGSHVPTQEERRDRACRAVATGALASAQPLLLHTPSSEHSREEQLGGLFSQPKSFLFCDSILGFQDSKVWQMHAQ